MKFIRKHFAVLCWFALGLYCGSALMTARYRGWHPVAYDDRGGYIAYRAAGGESIRLYVRPPR